ncbi:MAG: DUF1801 domain-containing protein [Dehalococcoidia bacterium]
MSTPEDVDQYIADQREESRATLAELRQAIQAAAPGATEVISYQLPTFKQSGRGLVAFGASRSHCGLYLMSHSVMEAHQDELKGYSQAKTTVHFPFGEPIPAALVEKLVKARIVEVEATSHS